MSFFFFLFFWVVVFYAWEHLLRLGCSEDFYFGMLLVLSVFPFPFFPDDSRHHCCYCLSFLSDLWVFDDTFFLSRMGR